MSSSSELIIGYAPLYISILVLIRDALHFLHGSVDVGHDGITSGGGDHQSQHRGAVDLNAGGEGDGGGVISGGDGFRPLRHKSAVLIKGQGHVSSVSSGHSSAHVDLIIAAFSHIDVGSVELDGAAAAGAAKTVYGSARVDGAAAGDGLACVIGNKSKCFRHIKNSFHNKGEARRGLPYFPAQLAFFCLRLVGAVTACGHVVEGRIGVDAVAVGVGAGDAAQGLLKLQRLNTSLQSRSLVGAQLVKHLLYTGRDGGIGSGVVVGHVELHTVDGPLGGAAILLSCKLFILHFYRFPR